jgi:maleylacetate reductase
VPVAAAEAARAQARDLGADTVVTVGGGSATGFGKAVALALDVRQVALPTTYAGSEMTTIWGLTDGDRKRTGKDPRVKPDLVVYDPELTLTLPPAIAGPSGMNALAHCVEALYGPGANPVVSLMALAGIRALHRSLPTVCASPGDLGARTEALYGAYLAGIALASGGTALHHKACHVLGGMFGLDHGSMNAVVLGHALAYNAPAVPEVMDEIGDALGTGADDAPGALHDLAAAIGAPTSLAAIGMPADGIDAAAERVVAEAAGNVRPIDVAGARRLLEDAYAGRRPAATHMAARPAAGGT